MPRRKAPAITLEEAKERFSQWRQNRQGKATIPDELWAIAAEVGRREGVSRTSTELHLGWNDLKQRITAEKQTVRRRTGRAQFVELIAPETPPLPECTIELEGHQGRLRMELRNASAAYLAALSRQLWESAF